jgi:hypothetical protein
MARSNLFCRDAGKNCVAGNVVVDDLLAPMIAPLPERHPDTITAPAPMKAVSDGHAVYPYRI